MAPKFTAQDNAPDTLESLTRNCGRLVVWGGGSDRTIYGEASVNHAFRAWHDSLHLRLTAPFTLEGETLVALEQARLCRNDALGDILMAEIVGQAHYFAKYGTFPVDQMAFITAYLKG